MTQLVAHDRARNVLVYQNADPRIQEMVPGTVALTPAHIGVPNTLYNLQMLRWLNAPVIAPMEDNYDWPRPRNITNPFEAQIVTANFLALNPRGFVLSDMRTGKTLAALWAADFLMRCFPGLRCLVVAPLSILQRVWGDNIFNAFMGRRSYAILHGPADRRRQLLAEPHDFYIINTDGLGVGSRQEGRRLVLGGLSADLAARKDIGLAIVDEASAYRDHTTKRHRIGRAILTTKPYLWLMTGTPTPTGPLNAYGMAKLVNNAHGETFAAYRNRVMMQVSQFKWIPRAGSYEEARKLLQPAVRFAIEDCADVPPDATSLRDVEFSAAQTKAYNEMKKNLSVQIGAGQKITAANEAVLRNKLIQIACGAVYGPDHEVNLVDASPRISELRRVLQQTDRKVVIFAPLTSVIHMLSKELSSDYTLTVINGEVGRKDRNERIRAFMQDKDPQLMIADPDTMSHGLDLSVATIRIWFAPTDKAEVYQQANERIRGPNQKVPTLLVQLASTPTEREIFRRLETNQSLQGVMLKMVRGDFAYGQAA